ncbi:hypothetical protein BDF21DRAFT_207326 [Thamnidium elegans]|nr:hypothetical protein BDF21DRAFT_207326 [Thamnidium elegans]
MSKLVDELAKSFDECLDSVLSDPQQQKEEGNEGFDTQLKSLKTTFLELENYLRQVRLDALADRPLAIKETNILLQRDIDVKTNMITKYTTKLDEWNSKIPELIENGKSAVALRTDGTDFEGQSRPVAATTVVAPPIIQEGEIVADEIPNGEIKKEDNHKDDEDDDDDDDVEFEEV